MIQDTGYRIQNTGYRIQDTGYRIQDTGYRILLYRIMENKRKTVEEFITKGERLMEDPKSPKVKIFF